MGELTLRERLRRRLALEDAVFDSRLPISSKQAAQFQDRLAGSLAKECEAENSRLRSQLEDREQRLRDFADSVERDRHEPDKLLCHVQSMRGAALRSGRD